MKRRLAVAAGWAAVLASAITIPAVAAHSGGRAHPAALAASQPAVRAYYQAAKTSLSPLIVHVHDIPNALRAMASDTGQENPAVAAAARRWAADCATARDLVGRLTPLPGPVGAQVARLYQTAAMLQTEAARTAATAAGEGSDHRSVDAVTGQQLYSLGDRLFDSAYRLLNSRGAMSGMEMRFPAAVPGFAGQQDSSTAIQSSPAHWLSANHTAVAMLASFGRSTDIDVTGVGAAQRKLNPTVTEPIAQEAVNDLRLAAVVWSRIGGNAELNARLHLIGDRLWTGALDLLSASGAHVTGLAVPSTSEDALFTGGAFNGHPPALRPGDAPGKDLPAGLPSLDSPALLGN
jgi:hypothetical protein